VFAGDHATHRNLSGASDIDRVRDLGSEDETRVNRKDDLSGVARLHAEIAPWGKVATTFPRLVSSLPADRNVEGVVEMMLDATQKYNEPLTDECLFGRYAALFPVNPRISCSRCRRCRFALGSARHRRQIRCALSLTAERLAWSHLCAQNAESSHPHFSAEQGGERSGKMLECSFVG